MVMILIYKRGTSLFDYWILLFAPWLKLQLVKQYDETSGNYLKNHKKNVRVGGCKAEDKCKNNLCVNR